MNQHLGLLLDINNSSYLGLLPTIVLSTYFCFPSDVTQLCYVSEYTSIAIDYIMPNFVILTHILITTHIINIIIFIVIVPMGGAHIPLL